MTTNDINIPNGWCVKKLGECFSFLKTVSYSREDTSSMGDVHYIHYGDIHTKYNLLTYPENIDIFVSNDKAQKADYLKTGDLILLDASEDYEGTTKCIEVLNVKDDKIISGLHTLALRDTSNSFADGFRAYLTSIPFVKRNFWKQVSGVKVYGISKDNLKKVLLPIPPLSEQEKIAEILSCWDEAIEKVSDLIEQKKLLKKGLMQKLLTGKTRLPGFTQPWKTVKLGEIGTFISGSAFPDNEQGGKLGIPFYKVSDMNNVKNLSYMTVSNNYVTEVQVSRLKLKPINHEAIIFAKVGAAIFLERKRLSCNFLIDNNMMAFIPFETPYYIKSVFDTLHLSRYVQVGALPSYNANDLKPIKITIPSDIAEQKAIADILSTADEEIEKLKTKLDLLKLQKKGLMQQLLTGKIRVKVDK